MPTPYAEPYQNSLATFGVGATPSQQQSSKTVAIALNRAQGTKAAGQTIAAGGTAAIASITPATTGKVKVSVTVAGSIDAPINMVLTRTPLLGVAVKIASWPATSSGSWVSLSFVLEVDSLPLGTLQTFRAITTLGDGNLTIGNGVDGVGAALLVEELQ